MKLVAEKHSYEVTPTDVLWLKRAVEAEGEPRLGVAQTLVNKFMYARARLGSTRTLADFVRAYASPVNPAWFVRGEKYKARVRSVARDRQMSPLERAAKLRRLKDTAILREEVHATRIHFRDDTEDAVRRALSRGPDIPTATDYSAWFDSPDPNRVPLTPMKAGENRFYRMPGAEDWPGYTVLLSAIPIDMPSTDAMTVLWLAIGIGIYLWSRNHGQR